MELRTPLAVQLWQQVLTSIPFPTIKVHFVARYTLFEQLAATPGAGLAL